jgi:hypothetical protein
MTKIVSLCPACTNCPTVELTEDAVRIGENGNRVTLTHDEWNVLVRAIKTGELDEVK